MFILYLIIACLLLLGIKIQRTGIYEGYIDKTQCNCIKGFFIVVVFCRHIAPYLMDAGYDFSILGDKIFQGIDSRIGQLLVVMFLFYSGYGVSESFKRKGEIYLWNIPKRRVLPTLINFDVAVLLFAIVNLCLGIDYPIIVSILSFTGWKSIGNSNWYIFVIISCYLSTYLTARLLGTQCERRILFGGG